MKKKISIILIVVFLSVLQNFSMANAMGIPEDVNGDGMVDLSDLILVCNDAALFVTGPVPTDVDGDGMVTFTDILLVYNAMIL